MYSGFIDFTLEVIRKLASDRDFNLELSGLEVGRQVRHLPKASRETPLERQKKDEQRATMTALHWLLLMDAEYAQQRERVQRILLEADTRLIEMHMEAERMASDSQAQLSEMINSASELNGEKVFLSKDRTRAETLDGRMLSDDERDQVYWRPGAASLEGIRAAQQRHDKITAYREEIARVQSAIDAHQHTLANDSDAPTTSDELAEMEQSARDAIGDLERMRHEVMSDPSADIALSQDFNAASPDLNFVGLAAPSRPPQFSVHQ